MTEPTQEAPVDTLPTIEVEDLNQFVQVLSSWHSQKVSTLRHMLAMPEGVEMVVSGETPVALTGDLLKGFKAGIELALMELGELPFLYETVPDAVPEAETTNV